MNSFFVSLLIERIIFTTQITLFILSLFLHLLVFICLLFRTTEENKSSYRYYLLFIQIMALASDLHYEVLFSAIPIFPATGGYCNGISCLIGVPMQYSIGLAILLTGNTGASVLLSAFFRHQTTVYESFRLTKKTNLIIHIAVLFLHNIPGIMVFFMKFDEKQTEELIDSNEFADFGWIRERGQYAFYPMTPDIHRLPFIIITVMTLAATFTTLSSFHLANYLIANKQRSSKWKAGHAVFVLIVQSILPIVLIIFPSIVFFSSLILGKLIPFELCLTSYITISFFPISHSISLLTLTPYRARISSFLRLDRIHVFTTDHTSSN